RGVAAWLAEASRRADPGDMPRFRTRRGTAPAGRAVHRVSAAGAGAPQGRFRLRRWLRRRRTWILAHEAGILGGRLRADGGAVGPRGRSAVACGDGEGDGEAVRSASMSASMRTMRTIELCRGASMLMNADGN